VLISKVPTNSGLRRGTAAKPRRLVNVGFLVDPMGGTDETLFGDLRVARGYRVRSATASAAGRDQPAAPAAGAPAAAEVTPLRPQFAEPVQPVSSHSASDGARPSSPLRNNSSWTGSRLPSRPSRVRCNCRRPPRFSKDRWSGGNRCSISPKSGWDGRDWAVGRYSIADIHLFRLYWRLRGGDITNSGAHDQRKGSQWRSRE